MSNPLDGLVAGFQDLVAQVPDLLQPLIVAVAGAVPFIEGEGSAMIGVIGGLHPLVAALAGVTGNLISVVLVVLLSSRIRTAAVTRRNRGATAPPVVVAPSAATAPGWAKTATVTAEAEVAPSTTEVPTGGARPESKGRRKLNRWLVRFGVPGASLLAPLALPTQITAATFAAAGIDKGRVIFWQAVAIVLWTSVATAAAVGLLAALSTG
jgi:hypothetical protein